MSQTMKHGLVETTYLVVHGSAAPGDAEWDDYTAAMERSAPVIACVFVYSLGGGPDSRQRRTVADVWRRVGKTPPISVVGPMTPFVRGVVTALSWFVGSSMRLWSPSDIGFAFDHARLCEPEQSVVFRRVEEWVRDLGHAEPLLSPGRKQSQPIA